MRLTRAAMRAQAPDEPDSISIHEDRDVDTTGESDSQNDEKTTRQVLRDITDENSTTTEEIEELKQSTRGRKPKSSKKKAKKIQETLEAAQTLELTPQPAVVTDTTVASEEQPEQQDSQRNNHSELPETLASVNPLVTSISESIPTIAPTPERHFPAIATKTPMFNADLHIAAPEPATEEERQDSFVDSIKTRSPLKLSREHSRDSFVESIKSRSPVKSASRIEDSVEAMDALEDAIEEFSTKLPQIDHIEYESPVKEFQPSPQPLPPSARKTALQAKVTKTPKDVKPSPAKARTAQLKSAPPRTNSGRVSTVKPTAKGPAISKNTVRPTTKPAPVIEAAKTMSFSNSPLKTQPNLAKKRVASGPLSTSRPAFVPAKSTKAPTKSTFTLPGEAYQARMKAQREAQAQKDDENTKKTFKARPVPNMTSRPSVAPRENKASLARKSSAPTSAGENKENEAPRRSSVMPASTAPASKGVDVKKTRPGIQANSSLRRTTTTTTPSKVVKKPSPTARPSVAPKPAPRSSMAPRVASLTKTTKTSPTTSSSNVAGVQLKPAAKVTGREVYGRTKLERNRMEQEKREKEEAAKKARAEAAERGRQASRDWAEKQKLKAAREKAAAAAKEGVVEGPVVEALVVESEVVESPLVESPLVESPLVEAV